MKKSLLIAAAALTVSASALAINAPQHAAKKVVNYSKQLTSTETTLKPMAYQGDYTTISDWESIGTGRLTDNLIAQACGASYYATISVEVEESKANPGLYRIMDPAKNNPMVIQYQDEIQEGCYMIVDATNPQNVIIPKLPYGIIEYYSGEMVYVWGNGGSVDDNYTITFPDWTMAIQLGENGSGVAANGSGYTFKLMLPMASDYTLEFTQSPTCNDGYFSIDKGKDIATVKYAIGNTMDDAQAKFSTNATELEGTEGQLTLSDGWTGMYIAGYDTEGNLKAEATTEFYQYTNNPAEWESVGTVTFCESFFGLYGSRYSGYIYDVEMEENVNTPGYFRLVNPLSNNTSTYYQYYANPNHDHYIFFDATNPEAVLIGETPIGMTYDGEWYVFNSGVGAGTFTNNVINMPAKSTAIGWMGENNGYYNNYDLTVIIPQQHTVSISSQNDAYGTVAFKDAEGTSITTESNYVTVVATPADGTTFSYWADKDGNKISESAEYTYIGNADIELVAHYGMTLTFEQPENGFIEVFVGTEQISTGSILDAGSMVDIVTRPKDDKYELDQLTINGTPVQVGADGTYSFEITESTVIVATFRAAAYTLTINVLGSGEVQVWSAGSAAAGPSGTQYFNGGAFSGNLRGFAKPAEGVTIESVEWNNGENTTTLAANRIQDMTATGFEGWKYFALSPAAVGSATITVKFSDAAGINEIGADLDAAEAEYYNLQGVRVAAENITTGFYILRQGSKASKVFIQR